MSGKRARAERKRKRNLPTYWHGGPSGLHVGTTLRPLTDLLGLPNTFRIDHPWFNDVDHSYVYGTTDRILARDYAARWDLHALAAMAVTLTESTETSTHNPWKLASHEKGGGLYRIAPEGDTYHDPDYPAGVGFRFRRARIVAVEEAWIPYSTKPSAEVLHYQTWDTGERIYDDDGFALANAKARDLGVTSEDLRELGYAPELVEIDRLVRQLAGI